MTSACCRMAERSAACREQGSGISATAKWVLVQHRRWHYYTVPNLSLMQTMLQHRQRRNGYALHGCRAGKAARHSMRICGQAMTPHLSLVCEQREQGNTEIVLSTVSHTTPSSEVNIDGDPDKGLNRSLSDLIRVKRPTSRQRRPPRTDIDASTVRLLSERLTGGVTITKVIGQYRRGGLHIKNCRSAEASAFRGAISGGKRAIIDITKPIALHSRPEVHDSKP